VESVVSRQKAESRRQKAEGRKQKAESRRQKAVGSRQSDFPFVICHLSFVCHLSFGTWVKCIGEH